MLTGVTGIHANLAVLATAPYEFTLTGSRELTPQYVTDQSDWDFWTQDTPEVRDWLQRCGYKIADTRDLRLAYAGMMNTAALAYDGEVPSYAELDDVASAILASQIHIQLVSDADLKKRADTMYWLLFAAEAKPADKQHARNRWNAIYKCLRVAHVVADN